MHPRQRLLRHPRGRPRGGRRRRPLPRHLRRRLLQPARQPGRRPRGRERGPGQRAQLAAADVPAPGRPVVRPGRVGGARLPARARPAPGGADPPVCVPRPGRADDQGDPAPLCSMADPHLAGLQTTVVPENWSGPGGPLGSRRHGDQRRCGRATRRSTAATWSRSRRRVGDDTVWLQVETTRPPGADRPGGPHPVVQDGQRARRRTADRAGARLGCPAPVPSTCARRAGHRGEDRGAGHLPGPGHRRAGDAAVDVWPAGRRVRRAAGAPRARLGAALAPLPHRPGRRRRPARSPAPSTCTCSTCCRRCPSTPSTWTWGCRPGACTARPTAATSSGTSCSSSRS